MNDSCFEQWATLRIQKGAPKESALKNSASVGKFSLTYYCSYTQTESFRATQLEKKQKKQKNKTKQQNTL